LHSENIIKNLKSVLITIYLFKADRTIIAEEFRNNPSGIKNMNLVVEMG
jgi:hypothetical protein